MYFISYFYIIICNVKFFLRHVFAAEFMIKEVKTQRSCHEREENLKHHKSPLTTQQNAGTASSTAQ